MERSSQVTTQKAEKAEFIPLSIPHMTGDEAEEVAKCFETNWVSSAGPQIDAFASEFSNYLGVEHAVPLVSGTAALHLALLVTGVKPGDSVMVSTLTFIAAVNPIAYCGAKPIFVDSERQTFNMDPDKAVAKIEELAAKGQLPKAIIIVHLYGHCAKVAPIIEACRRHEIAVIEDATESLGTRDQGRMTGISGDVGCYSFNGNKLITTGGGGMLTTRHSGLAEKAVYYSTQAKDDPKNYDHHEIGFNYRLTNIQAAMGLAQLRHIEEFVDRKRTIAERYAEALKDLPGLTTNPELDGCRNCFWLYCVLVEETDFGMSSRELIKSLNSARIDARPFWKPIHTMPMYQGCDATDLSNSLWLWERGLNLPSSVGLTKSQQDRVIQGIRNAAGPN